MKFLGVIIDDHLTWHEHCSSLYNTILVSKHLLQNAQNLLPITSLLKVYYAHIYSHLMYGLSVWGTMIPKKQLKNHKVETLYKQLGIIWLPDLIKQEQYRLGYKISHKVLPEPLIDLFDKKGGKNCHTLLEINMCQIYKSTLLLK